MFRRYTEETWPIGPIARGCRAQVRQLRRRTAGVSLPVPVARLSEYLRGWGSTFKRAQCSGVLDRMDKWVACRVRAYQAKCWRNTLWRRYPDQYLYGALGPTCLYALRRAFLRELAARRQAGNRPVERSAGDPHARFVRGTEVQC